MDFFTLSNQVNWDYLFKGMVCKTQCGYYSCFRVECGNKLLWCKFDDERVTKYINWGELVKDIAEELAEPCLLFFEAITREFNHSASAVDSM
jgi:hypothetical protein